MYNMEAFLMPNYSYFQIYAKLIRLLLALKVA